MDFNEWIYILDENKLPSGNISKLINTGSLGKWKYKIQKEKFKIIYSELKNLLKEIKEVINAKYVEDKNYVELNVYCLDKNKIIYNSLKKN